MSDPIETDPIEVLYKNLKKLEPYFDTYLQSDPVTIGRLGYDHRTERFCLNPAVEPAPDGIPEIMVNGRYITIKIEEDRGKFGDCEFDIDIIEIRDGDRIIFSKEDPWDHWPVKGSDTVGNIIGWHYDIREGTLVSGALHVRSKEWVGIREGTPFTVRLVRDPQCMAMGAFTLPVLPVALRYAPPQLHEPTSSTTHNTITYTNEQGTATTMKFSLMDESSRTVPTEGLDGPTLQDVLKGIQGGSKAAALMGAGVFAGAIDECLGAVAKCLGSITWEETRGTEQSSETSYTHRGWISYNDVIGDMGEEPGLGDRFVVLLNARFAWVSDNLKTVKLMPLGPAIRTAEYTIEDLLHDAAILTAQQEPPPVPLVTITSIYPTDPDGSPYISLGQTFTIHGDGFSSTNAENQIVIFRITGGVAQPGISVTPTNSQPDKLEAIALTPPTLNEGNYEIRVEVRNQAKSNYVDVRFHAPPPGILISITAEQLKAIRESLGLFGGLAGGGLAPRSRPNVRITAEWAEAVRNSFGLRPIPRGTELKTDLDLEAIQALLALDPLLKSGPNTDLSNNPRFQKGELSRGGGSAYEVVLDERVFDETYGSQLVESIVTTGATFTTHIKQEHAGSLDGFFGYSHQEQKLTSTTTVSTSHQDDTFTSRQIHLVLAPAPGKLLRGYYDMAFDSYVFQIVAKTRLQTEGIARDDSGNSLPNQWILFSIGDQSVLARTDAQGHYAIYSLNANPGPATLRIGNREQQIEVTPRRGR